MNEKKNNSLVSTIIFLCFATLAILFIVIKTEESIPATTSEVNFK